MDYANHTDAVDDNLTYKQLHEAVEDYVFVTAVEEHVGDKSPSLFPLVGVVDEEGIDGPGSFAELERDP